MFRSKVVFSPVELEYLQTHIGDPKDQLCIALAKSKNAIVKKIKELQGGPAGDLQVSFQSKIGRRDDLDIFLRSGWEANMMRYMKYSKEFSSIEYEPTTFSFTDHVAPKGMALSYTPDFKVKYKKKEHWIEVKGNWLRGSDKTKMRRWLKYYPEEFKKLLVVVSTKTCKTAIFFRELGVPESNILEYNKIKKEYSTVIKNWEK